MAIGALLMLCGGFAWEPASGAGSQREWNQAHADPAATSCVDVAPIRLTPRVAWRRGFDRVLAGPVVSGDVLYVLVIDRGDPTLYALQPADGTVLGRAGSGLVRGVTEYRLAAWHGIAAVVSDQQLVIYELDRGTLKFGNKVDGPWSAEPCIAEGTLFAGDGQGNVRAVDLHLGKVEGEAPLGWGRPSVLLPGDPGSANGAGALERDGVLVFAAGQRSTDGALALCSAWAEPLAKKTQFLAAECRGFAKFPGYAPGQFLSKAVLARVRGNRPGWYVHYGGDPTLSGYAADDEPGRRLMTVIETAPALRGADLFGYDPAGNLLTYGLDSGFSQQFAAAGHRPDGGWVGDLSIARDVIVSGNWAVDAVTRHVLWCLPEIRPARQSIPAADGLVAVVTVDQELVVLADPDRAAPAARSGPAEVAGSLAPPEFPELPGSGPGLVLVSGEFLAGEVTRLPTGEYALAPERGAISFHSRGAVALADFGAEHEYHGPESAVHAACWRALEARQRAALAELFERFLAVHLVAESRRLLDEAQEYGLDAAGRAAWSERLAGQRESDSALADLQLKRALSEEQAKKREIALSVQAASHWAAGLGLFAAASDLATRADAIAPIGAAGPARALAWVPAEFPWRLEGEPEQVVAAWMAWAGEILPAGGAFVAADDPLWQRLAGSVWATGAIALSTDDLLLVTRENDPRVVGPCLCRAQETIRLLAGLFGSPPGTHAALEMRLHRTREEYLAEPRFTGAAPVAWSAGYYAPDEGVSRFHVPRERASEEPLGHDLAHLLAHELAHQWIHQRWHPEGVPDAGTPGHWLVEGVAELAADLALVEPGSDEPPLCLQVSADAAAQIDILPLAALLALSAEGFRSLANEDLGLVQPRRVLRPIKLDTRGLFYAQSGALAHFLLFGEGAEAAAPGSVGGAAGDATGAARPTRREATLAWLASIYDGHPSQTPWVSLGFADLDALAAAFQTHLRR